MKASILLALFMHCAFCVHLVAQINQIDQSYTPTFNDNFFFVATRGPEGGAYAFGQEFVPTLPALDFVDLYIDVRGNPKASLGLYVEIRSETIDGPLLGTSTPLGYNFNYRGEAHLTFPSPISLSPGETYVIRAYELSSGFAGLVTRFGVPHLDAGSGYDAGRWIYPSDPPSVTDPLDVWFREGITVVPEPGTCWLLALAGFSLVLARRFRHAR